MFIEVKRTDGAIELLNTSYIIKVMQRPDDCRINMTDGSYSHVDEDIDDIWARMTGGE